MDSARAEIRPVVFTIGHSNHPIERFLGLLRKAGVTALGDVRSVPFSRRWPQYSRPALEQTLRESGIAYVFLGAELGGKRDDPALLRDGRPDFDLIAATAAFDAGLDRVVAGARKHRICLMCAEKEPLDCHRFLLVSRHLAKREVEIRHLLADGSAEEHAAAERRLLERAGFSGQPLLDRGKPSEDMLAAAYVGRMNWRRREPR